LDENDDVGRNQKQVENMSIEATVSNQKDNVVWHEKDNKIDKEGCEREDERERKEIRSLRTKKIMREEKETQD
jgi:hypothetical protein